MLIGHVDIRRSGSRTAPSAPGELHADVIHRLMARWPSVPAVTIAAVVNAVAHEYEDCRVQSFVSTLIEHDVADILRSNVAA